MAQKDMIQLFIFHSANKGAEITGGVKYSLGITDHVSGNNPNSVVVCPRRNVTVKLEIDFKDSFQF